jgi:hypothetical protein
MHYTAPQDATDIVTDITFASVPFKTAPSLNGSSLLDDSSTQSSLTSLQVHSGFALAFESVREQIDHFISTTRRDTERTTNHTLLFTGKQHTCYL